MPPPHTRPQLLSQALACLLTALPGLAAAQEPLPGGPSADAPRAPPPAEAHAPAPSVASADRLDAAIRAYQSGQYDLALFLLTAILAEDTTDATDRQQALVYLAEVFLAQGNEASARESFEAALELFPGLQLDPFEHPPDVCAFFEVVKATWRPRVVQPTITLDLRPPPTSPWMPLGIAQQRQGRPVPGTLMAVGQGLSCGLSAGMFAWLALDRRFSDDPGETTGEGGAIWRLETLRSRRTVQWLATGTCQTLYGLGVLDAALVERKRSRQSTDTSQGARQLPSPMLQVSGRF